LKPASLIEFSRMKEACKPLIWLKKSAFYGRFEGVG
jgi:hypothetical protein